MWYLLINRNVDRSHTIAALWKDELKTLLEQSKGTALARHHGQLVER